MIENAQVPMAALSTLVFLCATITVVSPMCLVPHVCSFRSTCHPYSPCSLGLGGPKLVVIYH